MPILPSAIRSRRQLHSNSKLKQAEWRTAPSTTDTAARRLQPVTYCKYTANLFVGNNGTHSTVDERATCGYFSSRLGDWSRDGTKADIVAITSVVAMTCVVCMPRFLWYSWVEALCHAVICLMTDIERDRVFNLFCNWLFGYRPTGNSSFA